MLSDFQKFLMRGNVFDLAVGVVIGTAFGKIVTSLVDDILMPPLALLLGHMDFSNRFITLGPGTFETLAEARKVGAVTLNYGIFINSLVDFVLIALALFLAVRYVNRLRGYEAAPPTTRECPLCLSTVPRRAVRCAHCTADIEPVS